MQDKKQTLLALTFAIIAYKIAFKTIFSFSEFTNSILLTRMKIFALIA